MAKQTTCKNELCGWFAVPPGDKQCPYCGAHVNDFKYGNLYPFEREAQLKKDAEEEKQRLAEKKRNQRYLLIGMIFVVIMLFIVGVAFSIIRNNQIVQEEFARLQTDLVPTPLLPTRLGQATLEERMPEFLSVPKTLPISGQLLTVENPPDGSPLRIRINQELLTLQGISRRDIEPRLAPNGERFAYIDNDSDGFRQVWIWDRNTLTSEILSDPFSQGHYDAIDIAWKPDSSTLAVAYRAIGVEEERYSISFYDFSSSRWWSERFNREDYISGLDWSMEDGVTYFVDITGQSKRLIITDLDALEVSVELPTLSPNLHLRNARWSPDGQRLAFIARQENLNEGMFYIFDAERRSAILYRIQLTIDVNSPLTWVTPDTVLYLSPSGQPFAFNLTSNQYQSIANYEGQGFNSLDFSILPWP